MTGVYRKLPNSERIRDVGRRFDGPWKSTARLDLGPANGEPHMKRTALLALLLVGFILGLSAIARSQTESEHRPVVVNLAIAWGNADCGHGLRVEGDWVFGTVDEIEQDMDLNDDGDLRDSALFAHDTRTQTTSVLPLAIFKIAPLLEFGNGFVAFEVSESQQGDTDLNGDGDSHDNVLHVLDICKMTVTNLRLAALWFRAGDEFVAFNVWEFRQGETDLNGDGDALDTVLHVFDFSTGVATNLGFDVVATSTQFCQSEALTYSVSSSRVAFLAREAGDQVDHNGDGDLQDSVLHLYDAQSQITTNLALACDSTFDTIPPMLMGEFLVFLVDEEGQFQTDLTGDGDTKDGAFHVLDLATMQLTNFALASRQYLAGENQAAFVIAEYPRIGQDVDLNGDGDRDDQVVHVFSPTDFQVRNLGVAVASRELAADPNDTGVPTIIGDLITLKVSERDQGSTDLNGDGDTNDEVLHVYDQTTGLLANTGLQVPPRSSFPYHPSAIGKTVFFVVGESGQGFQDLNGDGDTDDNVLHSFGTKTSEIKNLEFAVSNPSFSSEEAFRSSERWFVFPVSEPRQEKDLDGDGSIAGDVLLSYDVTSGTLTPIASYIDTSDYQIDGDLLAYVVREVEGDLNGDGDNNDSVAHVADLSFSSDCLSGTVNSGIGPVVDVLRVNGDPGTVIVQTGDPVTLSLDAPPAGPLTPTYLLYAWAQEPSVPVSFLANGFHLGCTANPTPLFPGLDPQPIRCVRGDNLPAIACGNVSEVNGPPSAPFTLEHDGIANALTFTIQALIRDDGAANGTGFSVSNAVVLEVVKP